ncbi:MAG: hypothetical protein COC06_08085 [Bacteroidales bacterium]|nr:MAG: hypothetical protein COC06_08085 [Bacteroidales bacterium]
MNYGCELKQKKLQFPKAETFENGDFKLLFNQGKPKIFNRKASRNCHKDMKKQLIILVSVLVVLILSLVVFDIKSSNFVMSILPLLIMAIAFIAIVSGSIIIAKNKKLRNIEKIILIGIILIFNIFGVIICLVFLSFNESSE